MPNSNKNASDVCYGSSNVEQVKFTCNAKGLQITFSIAVGGETGSPLRTQFTFCSSCLQNM